MLNRSCETKYVSFIGVIVGIHTHPDCGKSIEENKIWGRGQSRSGLPEDFPLLICENLPSVT